MYALIGCKEDGGEPVLLNTARTLNAAQKKMDKVLQGMALTQNTWQRYRFLGFLTAQGLVNYDGERISKSALGTVTLKMGVELEAL